MFLFSFSVFFAIIVHRIDISQQVKQEKEKNAHTEVNM